MFSPGRLILVLTLALVTYVVFFAVPGNVHAPGDFDPDHVAADEVAVWQGIKAKDDVSVYLNFLMMERDQHHYTWFRATESGFYLARATTTFEELHSRYERVLPDLEDSATIEKNWVDATFDPAAVARAELNWWVTRQMPNLNSAEGVAALMAEEYSLRYHLGTDRAMPAAALRTEAAEMRDAGGIDPDWPAISKRLAESYRSLRGAIQQSQAATRP